MLHCALNMKSMYWRRPLFLGHIILSHQSPQSNFLQYYRCHSSIPWQTVRHEKKKSHEQDHQIWRPILVIASVAITPPPTSISRSSDDELLSFRGWNSPSLLPVSTSCWRAISQEKLNMWGFTRENRATKKEVQDLSNTTMPPLLSLPERFRSSCWISARTLITTLAGE